MNLNIIYEPYIFSFIVALLISIIYYFNERNKIVDEDEEIQNDASLLTKSIVALLISYIIIMIIYYSYKYLSFNFTSTALMAGGAKVTSSNEESSQMNIEEVNKKREKIMERLTVVDDDVDVSILEN